MNNKQLIKSKLEEHLFFRERKNKNNGIARLLIRKHNLTINEKILEDIIVEASSMDRIWRQVLQENPHLRGHDYDKKDIVEQNKEIELGYEVGYNNDIKQNKLI